jgi:predicted Co/Zn/Cd cation transporter (cation efflux family)
MTLLMILGYIGLGAFVGLLSHVVLLDRGLKILPSIWVSALGALFGGIISTSFNLIGSGFYALICSFLILFTFNVFRTKDDPIFE